MGLEQVGAGECAALAGVAVGTPSNTSDRVGRGKRLARPRVVAGATALLGALLGCVEHRDPPVENDLPAESTAEGAPLGEAVVATIGPDGGTLTSADGLMRIAVPPGALDSPVQVGVQVVTNQAFGGIGNAYRLSPRQLVLKQPAQLSFRYTDAELGGMFVEAMSIAVQDREGFWHGKQTVTRDTGTSTMTISTMSLAVGHDAAAGRAARADAPDAGSDWTKFWTFRLVPSHARVKVNKTLDVSLQSCTRDKPTVGWPIEDAHELHHCDPSAPLSGVTIGKWSVMGPGTIAGSGASAVYTAPSDVTDQLRCLTAGEWSACAQVHLTIVAHGQNVERVASTGIDISKCLFLQSVAGGVCESPTWTGTASETFTFDRTTEREQHHVEASVTFKLAPGDDTGTRFEATGTATYSASGMRYGCPVELAPTTRPVNGYLVFGIEAQSLTYSAFGSVSLTPDLDYVVSCGSDSIVFPDPPYPWLDVVLQTAPIDAETIAGTLKVGEDTATWSFTRMPPRPGARAVRTSSTVVDHAPGSMPE